MENDDKFSKGDLLGQIDIELAETEENTSFAKRDAGYFLRMEIMTYFRNAIYNMPINDYHAGLIHDEAGTGILDDLYTYWLEQSTEWRGTQRDKIEGAIDQVENYILFLEHHELTQKLHEKALNEATAFNLELISKPADTILINARRFIAFDDILRLIGPDNAIENKDILALLTIDRPLAAVYETFRYSMQNSELSKADLTAAVQRTAYNRADEIQRGNAELTAEAPDSRRWLSVYVSNYHGTTAAGRPNQEHEPDEGMEP